MTEQDISELNKANITKHIREHGLFVLRHEGKLQELALRMSKIEHAIALVIERLEALEANNGL